MTDTEKIAVLEARLAALEAPAPPSSFNVAVANAIATLGKPDSIVFGQMRGAMLAVGGGLVAKGYTDTSSMTEVIGAVLAVLGLLWSLASKYAATHWLEVAVQAPPTTTLPELAAIVKATPLGAPVQVPVP